MNRADARPPFLVDFVDGIGGLLSMSRFTLALSLALAVCPAQSEQAVSPIAPQSLEQCLEQCSAQYARPRTVAKGALCRFACRGEHSAPPGTDKDMEQIVPWVRQMEGIQGQHRAARQSRSPTRYKCIGPGGASIGGSFAQVRVDAQRICNQWLDGCKAISDEKRRRQCLVQGYGGQCCILASQPEQDAKGNPAFWIVGD